MEHTKCIRMCMIIQGIFELDRMSHKTAMMLLYIKAPIIIPAIYYRYKYSIAHYYNKLDTEVTGVHNSPLTDLTHYVFTRQARNI